MRALKIFVTVMGVVIVVGFGVVFAVIAGRMARRAPATAVHPFAGGTIVIPAGARVEAITASADRLILDLALPDGAHRIIVVDSVTGARLGTIELRPAPR
jgi:hypothetical protein